MFGRKQRKIDELELENAELSDELSEMKAEKRRKELREENLCEVYEQLYASSFSFDWKTGKAFSVERIHDWHDDGQYYVPTTVIGYIKQEGDKEVIGEWKFYCSQEEHERLVADFEAYRKKAK